MTDEKKHRIVRGIIVTVIIGLFVLTFIPFATSIVLAVLFAFALENHVKRFSRHNIKRRWLSVAILASLFLLVAVPIGLVVVKATSTVKKYAEMGLQNTPLYQSIDKLIQKGTAQVNSLAQRFDVDLSQLPQPNELLNSSAANIGNYATQILGALPDIVLNIFVFAIMLYYLVTQSKTIKKTVLGWDLVHPRELDQLIVATKKSSYVALIASAAIGCVQAGLLATIAYFLGYTEFMVLFVITFVFSLIPVIGAAPVAIVLALLSFIQGETGHAITLVVTAVIVGSVDNLIKPIIVNSNDEVHPVIALVTLIGAILIFGAPGILIGPVLTELAFKIGPIFYPMKNHESV